MSRLAHRFPAAIDLLDALFHPRPITERLHRLDEIFDVTEDAWKRNLSRLDGKAIQYLLIAEAAPWTDPGNHPRYFYETLDGAWVMRILRAFCVDAREREDALRELANRGFLLVDTLPFALPYTTQMRRRPKYLQLLRVSQDYFLHKICDERLQWSDDLRVALAFKWHGRRTIEACLGAINLSAGRQIPLNEQQIAADNSGYTSTPMLRERFALNQAGQPCLVG